MSRDLYVEAQNALDAATEAVKDSVKAAMACPHPQAGPALIAAGSAQIKLLDALAAVAAAAGIPGAIEPETGTAQVTTTP